MSHKNHEEEVKHPEPPKPKPLDPEPIGDPQPEQADLPADPPSGGH